MKSLSPKGTSGFGCHFDDHDVLALQLYGTKEWSIYAPSYHAPDRGDKSFHLPSPSGSPTVVSRLEVGNGLYLPFGYWHNVETLSNISLHVTFGLDFARRGDVLDELARELAKDRFFRDKLQIDNCAEAALIKSRLVETIQQLDVGKLLVRMQNQRNQKPRTFRFPNP